MIITLHDLELPEELGLYWMRKQFVRHKLKHKVNSPPAPHILGKPRRNKLTAGKASHSGPGHQDSVEQGVTEGGAEERPFVLSWIQGCWLPFLSVEMWAGCRQGGKPLHPAPCPLQGKEVMEAREGGLCGQRALGKSVPVDARHRQPRYERITARKHTLVRSGRYQQCWAWVQYLLEAAASRKRNAQTKIQLSRWSCPPGTATGGVSCKYPLPLAKRRSPSFLCFLVVFLPVHWPRYYACWEPVHTCTEG